MSESLMPAIFFRFQAVFPCRNTAVSCCLKKEASFFLRSKEQTLDNSNRSVRFSWRERNYWVTGWDAEGVGY